MALRILFGVPAAGLTPTKLAALAKIGQNEWSDVRKSSADYQRKCCVSWLTTDKGDGE